MTHIANIDENKAHDIQPASSPISENAVLAELITNIQASRAAYQAAVEAFQEYIDSANTFNFSMRETGQFVSIQKAAFRMGISYDTMRKRIKRGKITVLKINGKKRVPDWQLR